MREVRRSRFVEEDTRTHSRIDDAVRLIHGQKYASKVIGVVSGVTKNDRNRLQILRELLAANTVLRFGAGQFPDDCDMRLEYRSLVLVREFANGVRQPGTGIVGWFQPQVVGGCHIRLARARRLTV